MLEVLARRAGVGVELGAALARCRAGFIAAGAFSGVINLLALTGSLYMLQIYDRVLPAHNVPTLVGLTLLMLLLYAAFGLFDHLRNRVMSRIGVRFERCLRDRVTACTMLLPLRARNSDDGRLPMRYLDQIRGFMIGSGPTALFDLPWLPFYLGISFLLHPWLGILGLGGAALLTLLMIVTETKTRKQAEDANFNGATRQAFLEAWSRNAETARALGMGSALTRRWSALTEQHMAMQVAVADITGSYGSVSKAARMALQSAVLGLGAYLAIRGEVTAGTMVAASILVSRGLAPIELAIANWRGLIVARRAAAGLEKLLEMVPPERAPLALPSPCRSLDVEGISVAAPGLTDPVLRDVSFRLEAGSGLGVIGPAAAGKTTLARALVGAWSPQRGVIRLDGAALDQWLPDALGCHIGYLPQSIELFAGTIAENIARLDPAATGDLIIAAARAAGVHEMILRLPKGYETAVGDQGARLSAGQRQRVALARALYGDPFLVVLDEPNSNLDSEGDTALTQAIASVRRRGGIVVVIAHRPSAIVGLDRFLVLGDGRVQALGSKDDAQQPAGSRPPMQMPRRSAKL